MSTYITRITTELWTKTGNRTGLKPPIGTVLETSGTFWIQPRDKNCYVISARTDGTPYPGDYINKCVEQVAVEAYAPDPEPTIHVTHTILVYNDGSLDLDGIHYPPQA